MAFKGGQPIQAGLGAANFSPIVQGGMAMGQAYANVGQNVGQGIMNAVQSYQQKKAEKEQTDAAINMMVQRFNLAPDEAKAAVKGVGPINAINFFAQEQQQQQRINFEALNRLGTLEAASTARNEDGTIDVNKAYTAAGDRGVMDFTLLNEIIDNANRGPSTIINMPNGDALDKKEQEDYAADRRSFQKGLIDSAPASEQLASDTSRGIQLLEEGARTGAFQTQEMFTKRVAELVGIDTNVAKQEELNQLLGKQVMSMVQQTKGSVSNKEMALFQDYSASPSKTPEGNIAIMRALNRKAVRDMEMARIAENGRMEGKSSSEIQKDIINYRESNPLFDNKILNSDNPYSALTKNEEPVQLKLQKSVTQEEAQALEQLPPEAKNVYMLYTPKE